MIDKKLPQALFVNNVYYVEHARILIPKWVSIYLSSLIFRIH
jgi:HSP90 family molecular chaperone